VEGETLQEQIARGPIPVDEALKIALQICEGLEAAHEKGIIHRDLKPANIKITPEGMVKILDFGLAKALEGETAVSDLSRSPTLTQQVTQAGMILGTAAYMSPEQARGKPLDKRTDIWAFGCVFYEMLTGSKAFAIGDTPDETVSDILASVLAREPDWKELPRQLSCRLKELLMRCLSKELTNRLHDIGDARLDIQDARSQKAGPSDSTPDITTVRRRTHRLVAAVCCLVVLIPVSFWAGRLTESAEKVENLSEHFTRIVTIDLSDSAPLALDGRSSLGIDSPQIAISPNGKMLVYVGSEAEGETQLFARDLQTLGVRPIEGTLGAIHPFFSPDGQSIGFLTKEKVKVVGFKGGAPRPLCNVVLPVAATWTNQNLIYIGSDDGRLWRVSSEGGDIEEALSSPNDIRYGKVLPDGNHVLASQGSGSTSGDYANLCTISLSDGKLRTLLKNGYDPRFVAPDLIVFGRGGDLFAVGFDADRLETAGQPWRVASGVRMDPIFRTIQMAVSDNGILAYVPGRDSSRGQLAWIDRSGQSDFLPFPEDAYGQVALSIDGRIAVHKLDVRDYIQVITDWRLGKSFRLEGPTSYGWPIWSHHGDKLAFAGPGDSGKWTVLVKTVDLVGEPQLLSESEEPIWVVAWGPSDERILAQDWPVSRRYYLPDSDSSPMPRGFVPSGESEAFLDVDRSGRWLAIHNGTGIQVRSMDGKLEYTVSPASGTEPIWGDECEELFYRSGNRFYSSKVKFEPDFQWEEPELIWEVDDFIDTNGQSFEVTPDGQKLLVVKRSRKLPRDKVHLIQHWLDPKATSGE
jgi:serine/threonine-protein kinase